jgi:hypothetical protein
MKLRSAGDSCSGLRRPTAQAPRCGLSRLHKVAGIGAKIALPAVIGTAIP